MPSCAFVKSDGGVPPRRRAILRDRRGATSLEFAGVGALLVSLIIGGMETSRYMFTLESVRVASAAAVRQVTILGGRNLNASSGACANLSGSLAGVAAQVPYLRAGTLRVTMSGCATQGGVTTVTVTVQYPFSFVVPLFGSASRNLTEVSLAEFH